MNERVTESLTIAETASEAGLEVIAELWLDDAIVAEATASEQTA